MTSLKGTVLGGAYVVFGVDNDIALCSRMSTIGVIYTTVVGIYTLFFPAPYGRYQKSGYGFGVNAKVAWLLQECWSFVFPLYIILVTEHAELRHFSNVIALTLFMLHYFQRSFIYPFTTSSQAKPVPVVTLLSAVVFTSYNGLLQGLHLSNVVEISDSFHGLLGTSIFLAGMAINISHDQILNGLRKDTPSTSSATAEDNENPNRRYKIPRGGLFEYVSGANYLGEILEWIGLAVITREYPQMTFAVFSCVFLGIRAIHHHRFYKNTFGSSYPKSRKAVIPFIL